MKTSDEIRIESWKVMREGGWIMKYFIVAMTLVVVFGVVQYGWDYAIRTMGIQTWSMFFDAKVKALRSGLDLTVPSRAIMLRMSEASTFEMFISCIVNGIFIFGTVGLFLHAAKGGRKSWFALAFGGFKCPLDVAWLYFRYVLQIVLWSLLFIVPGVMAYYRYRQCWLLKVENPDWSAGKCIAESCRMMKGNGWRCFCLDCSYWKPVTFLLLGFLLLAFFAGLTLVGTWGGIVGFLLPVLAVACAWGCLILAVYMSIGRALFYLDLKKSTAVFGGDSGDHAVDTRLDLADEVS